MKKDRYVIFQNEKDASEFILEIDHALGEHWDNANIHSFNKKAIVAWNDEYLRKAEHLLTGKKTITRNQAEEQGWNFGYHKGAFAKASTKLEDAMFARDSLDMFDRYPNFPAYRAIFFGIISALYGVKEGLRYACEAIGGEAPKWWSHKFKEIQGDPLLKIFYDLHNSDKHDLQIKYLQPNMRLYSYSGPPPHVFSGEGVFSIINPGTKDERRVFHDGAVAEFECFLAIDNLKHKNDIVNHLPLKQQIDLVIQHYKELVWEARNQF